jgi:hypothetical protein
MRVVLGHRLIPVRLAATAISAALLIACQSSASAPHLQFSRLALDSVQRSGERIVVHGSTDLPDGASLLITLEAVDRQPPPRVSLRAQGTPSVKAGQFEATFGPFVDPELSRPPHSVDVILSPAAQSQTIRDLVGRNGEYLTGPQSRKTDLGFTVLETTQRVVLP